MRRHRTTAHRYAQDQNPRARILVARTRGTVLSLLLAGLLAAAASPQAGGGSGGTQAVPRLVFPLVAKTELWDNYGDPRPNGSHGGIDMENPWRAPVVAVEAGRVDYHDSGLGGCMLYLYGRSGTMYMYIHLNNDLTARNDNRGGCKKNVTFAVPDGARVSAGQQIAWNGDSGDAEGNPHLHFEVHPEGGAAVSPYRHLKRAVKPLFAAKLGAKFSLGLRGHLVAVGEETVQLDVEQVRHYPGGSWLTIDTKRVELATSSDVSLQTQPTVSAATARRVLKGPVPVLAVTPKARTTEAALVGAPRSLRAGRVSVLR